MIAAVSTVSRHACFFLAAQIKRQVLEPLHVNAIPRGQAVVTSEITRTPSRPRVGRTQARFHCLLAADGGGGWQSMAAEGVVSKNVEVDGSSLGKFLCGSSVQTLCRADQGPEDQDSQSWQPNAESFLCACASACRSPTRRSPESWPWELSREHDDLRALVNQFMYPKTPEQLLLQLQKAVLSHPLFVCICLMQDSGDACNTSASTTQTSSGLLLGD